MITPRLAALLLVLIYCALSAYAGNLLPLRLVRGDSMEPVLYAGDVILLKSASISEVSSGDIVAYRIPDPSFTDGNAIIILHRVLRAESHDGQRFLLTKGDNSTIDPWPVTSSLVEGKLALRFPGVARPLLFLTSSWGIATASIAALLPLLYLSTAAVLRLRTRITLSRSQ